MIGAFDPASYPGPRASGPVLVHRGRSHRVAVDGPADRPVRLLEPTADGAPTEDGTPTGDGETTREGAPTGDGEAWEPAVLSDPADVRWSVAYGSNASPARLVAKGLDIDGALLLPARLADVVPAFEHRRTGYGSVPLTVVPSPGVVLDTWVLGLPSRSTCELDRTEGRLRGEPDGAAGVGSASTRDRDGRYAPPGTYRLGDLGPATVADRFHLAAALAYLPGPATRVQCLDDGAWRTWPESGQRAARAHLESGGSHRSAPTWGAAVAGDWPSTPLFDLPLFVYGTLRPDGSAWERIADLVDVIGPATTRGTIHDTGLGWPAATFMERSRDTSRGGDARLGDARLGHARLGDARLGDAATTIRGVLLAPRGPEQAVRLFRTVDAYEGVPTPYRRTSVRVRVGDAVRWAATYAWADPSPPGVPIAGGEWVVR